MLQAYCRINLPPLTLLCAARRATFEEELQSQRSYMQMLQKMLGVQQPGADRPSSGMGLAGATSDAECDSSHALDQAVTVGVDAAT
jgi:hypothetical protein